MKESRVDLSIVVPIHNTSRYLPDCLDSLLNSEGIGNTELILIDDGSTDKSGEIADKYADRYDFISCCHTRNAGLSAARNLGLNKSRGKYVFFYDSDDKVDPLKFSTVIRLTGTNRSDVILWDGKMESEDGLPYEGGDKNYYIHDGLDADDGILSGRETIRRLLSTKRKDYPIPVWLGAYRRDYLMDSGVLFPEGFIHEDELWSHLVLLQAESILYLPEQVYIYRIHKGSITHPSQENWKNHIDSILYVFPELFRYSDEILSGDPLKKQFETNLTSRYLYLIDKYRMLKKGSHQKPDMKTLWKKAGSLRNRYRILRLYARSLF